MLDYIKGILIGSSKNMKCLICHIEISGNDNVDCPSNHSVHSECLKEWLTHSKNCPLCSTPYSQEVIDTYKGYFEQKEREKLEAFNQEQKEKEMAGLAKLAEKMEFKKTMESIEKMTEQKDYVGALDIIDTITGKREIENKYNLMFLKGKVNFLRGRYDLAINHLFKLVKEKFDYPDAFQILGQAYKELGLEDKAEWAFERAK